MKRLKQMMKVTVFALVLVFLVACGRDVSTVDLALEGHWKMTNATVNGDPLVDLAQEYEQFLDFDTEEYTTVEEGQTVIDVDYYYSEETLTVVNSESESFAIPYQVIDTDEENGTMTLEYTLNNDEIEMRINEVIYFEGEEREIIRTETNIFDVMFLVETEEEITELEERLQELGGNIILQVVYEMDFEFELEYVDDATAPEAAE